MRKRAKPADGAVAGQDNVISGLPVTLFSPGAFRALVPAVLLFLCHAAAPLHSITVKLTETSADLKNVSDDKPNAILDFGRAPSDQEHRLGRQYLELGYPTDNIEREIRIYTNNTGFKGSPEDPSGLILTSTSTLLRLPLFWISFSSIQASGSVSFSTQTESSWNQILDINDIRFKEKRDSAFVPRNLLGTSFIYFGTKLSTSAEGDYTTKIVLEIVNKVVDTGAPQVAHTAFKRLNFRGRPLSLVAQISEDVQVTTATFNFRFEGETAFSSVPVTLTQNPANPFLWTAKITLSVDQISFGNLEYFFDTSDGFEDSFSGTESNPHIMEILGEFSAVSESISSQAGGKISIIDDPSMSGTELEFLPGGFEGSIVITAKKLDPRTQPALNAQSPLFAYEFVSDHTVTFLKPAILSIRYDDLDGNGFVDGTNIPVSELKVFRLELGDDWRFLGGTVDEDRMIVKVKLTHLSTFGLFPAAGMVGDFRPREKIITPALRDGINDIATFDGLDDQTDPFTIKLFDITGRKVRTLNQLGSWDGTDDSGRMVESGVYLYQVHVHSRVISGTITVAK